MSCRKNRHLGAMITVLCVAAGMGFPSSSLAHDPMYPKLGFHFRLALAGDIDGRGPGQRNGMEPGFGGGVELEVPITNHFSLGGAVEVYGWTIARAPGSYNLGVDLLFMPRARIPFGDHPWHAEVYFGLPIGPSLSVPHDRFASALGPNPLAIGVGVTGGGRVGVRLNVDEIVGFFVDAGPMVQFVSFPHQSGGARTEIWHYQLVLRVGGSFGLRT